MLEVYERLFPYRLLFGILFFLALGTIDWRRHPDDPRRAKEYLFLLLAAVMAMAYGVIHDHITATISEPYFLHAKGLIESEHPYRLAVTLLAIQASYWVGLLAGAGLLLANNPSAVRPRLPYPELARLCALPLACAAGAAAIGGALFAVDAFGLGPSIEFMSGPAGRTRFLIVWGIHFGSYIGGALGAVTSVGIVIWRRRRRAVMAPPPSGVDTMNPRA